MNRQSGLQWTAAVAALLLPVAHALAQDVLAEVIVTAERRAVSEQVTAISMEVLKAEDMASRRTQYIADLQETTPNVTINNAGTFQSINIRGIGNSTISPSITTGVAVFQDGLLNAETITLGSQFLDLGTAEILRGPQGTFVGASSTGGAIRLNSVLPSLDAGTTGFVEVGLGYRNEVKVQGAVNLPISETLAARIAFSQTRRNSFFYNSGTAVGVAPSKSLGKQGSVDDMGARVSLLWKPNDKLQLIWRSETNRGETGGSPAQPNPRTFVNALGLNTHSRYWNYDDPAHDPDLLSINLLDARVTSLIDRHSLEATYTFANNMTLRSMSGFVSNDILTVEDSDSSSANAAVQRLEAGPDSNYYSQEFNLISAPGRLNWILGSSLFYRKTPARTGGSYQYTCGIEPATGAFTPCPGNFNAPIPPSFTVLNSENTVRSGAAFGQVNWEFIDNLELAVGARYNVDRNYTTGAFRSQSLTLVLPVAPPPFVVPTSPCPADITSLVYWSQVNWANAGCLFIADRSKYEEETPTWKIGLNWKPRENNFLYVFWTRGYKSGGTNFTGGDTFESEQVDDYEIGWKTTFAGGRARLNIGAFYMDYKNLQQLAFQARTGAANAAETVFNVPSATVQGIEADFTGRFGGWNLEANLGWVDSKLGNLRLIDRSLVPDSAVRAPGTTTDLRQCNPGETPALIPGIGCVDWAPYYKDLSGARNAYSPELQYGISVQYDWKASRGVWSPRIGFNHTDKSYVSIVRQEDYWKLDERNLLSASLTYTQGDWLVQAYCQNCSDERYIAAIGAGGGLGTDSVLYGNPLMYGIRFRKGF